MSPENQAQFEYHKMQLMGTLTTVANSMRECAAVADQFAHLIAGVPYMGQATGFPPLANGQYGIPMMAPMGQDEGGKKRKSRADDAEVKRRAKKPKDPQAPKRPASSYLLFQNDVRNELKAKNPGMRNNELLSAIAKLWSEMPQDQKDAYENRNKVLKDRWREEKAAYESGKTDGSAVPVPVAAPAPAPAVVPPPAKVVPVAVEEPQIIAEEFGADPTSSDSSDDEDDDDDEEEEEEVVTPPPKKSKKGPAVSVIKDDASASKKERKHKKSKA